jgi:hypothetical protein
VAEQQCCSHTVTTPVPEEGVGSGNEGPPSFDLLDPVVQVDPEAVLLLVGDPVVVSGDVARRLQSSEGPSQATLRLGAGVSRRGARHDLEGRRYAAGRVAHCFLFAVAIPPHG